MRNRFLRKREGAWSDLFKDREMSVQLMLFKKKKTQQNVSLVVLEVQFRANEVSCMKQLRMNDDLDK